MDILTANNNTVINTDPGVVDPENRNFNFTENSPAHKIGFKPIPFEKIGLTIDQYRTSLPEKK